MNTIIKDKRVIFLTVIMINITFLVACISILLLYNNAQKGVYDRLTDIVQREKSFTLSLLKDQDANESKIIGHLNQNISIGLFGEIVYAKRAKDSIEFFITSNEFIEGFKIPDNITDAQPMQRALDGESGILKTTDYNGIPVFAAYTFVKELNWGIVAKIPTREINKPYKKAVIIVFVLAILLISISIYFLMKILNPIIDKLELSNKELLIAKEKAEEADKLKTSFLANMSHEIRTPMNGIIGFTSLLQDHELTGEKQQEYIEIIKKSGDRMLSTVNDIIEISKIETGQMQFSSSKVNISEHLKTLYTFFSLEAEKKGLQLILDNKLSEDESLIFIDKSKLDSILTNLLKNAIKFTKNGNIKIGCKRNADFLEFYVKDTGKGIPSTRKEAIFNRFEQADIEDREVHEGSGLGLTITKSYVEMLNGSIWLESEVNKGSTFFFTIAYNPVEPKAKKAKTIKSQITLNANNLNVLIVEDDDTSALFVSKVLEDSAKNIQIARDGLEAVEMSENNPNLDIILMDIKLPKLNGLEATKRIRKFNKDVKIIAQTAYALEGDREQAIKAGCNEYISKPVDKEKLLKIINRYFLLF